MAGIPGMVCEAEEMKSGVGRTVVAALNHFGDGPMDSAEGGMEVSNRDNYQRRGFCPRRTISAEEDLLLRVRGHRVPPVNRS